MGSRQGVGNMKYRQDANGVQWPMICICGGEAGRFCPVCNLDLSLLEEDTSGTRVPIYSPHGVIIGWQDEQ